MRVFGEYSVAVIDDNCQVILGERKLSCRTNFSVTQSAEKEPRQNLLGLIDMENRFKILKTILLMVLLFN